MKVLMCAILFLGCCICIFWLGVSESNQRVIGKVDSGENSSIDSFQVEKKAKLESETNMVKEQNVNIKRQDDIASVVSVKNDGEECILPEPYVVSLQHDLKSLKKDFKLQEYSVRTMQTATGKYYIGESELDDKTTYKFKMNATTGDIEESGLYESNSVKYPVKTKEAVNPSDVERVVKAEDMEEFSMISLDIDPSVDCMIRVGDQYSVNANFYGEGSLINVEIRDRILYITSEHTGDEVTKRNTITITVPREVVAGYLKEHTGVEVSELYGAKDFKSRLMEKGDDKFVLYTAKIVGFYDKVTKGIDEDEVSTDEDMKNEIQKGGYSVKVGDEFVKLRCMTDAKILEVCGGAKSNVNLEKGIVKVDAVSGKVTFVRIPNGLLKYEE